jgi:hypothetical protein
MMTDDEIENADLTLGERPANQFGGALATRPSDSAGLRQGQSRELAEMQTKFLMAQQFPRDERKAMDGVLNAFSRPGLAEHAQYEYAKGGSKISGLSIHAMQAIAQQWGNIEFGWIEVSRGTGTDGVPYSEVRAVAADLQSRTIRPLQFIVRHWRDTKQGGYKLKDEREIYELCANMAQRRVRSCLEAVIPKDVQDAAEQQADLTLRTKADTSPEAMHKMVEAFGKMGVTKEQIEKRIQRRLDAITPAQVVGLKRIYASLRDEMSEPAEWFEMAETAAPAGPPPANAVDKAKEAIKARAAKKGGVDPATGEISGGPAAKTPPAFDYLAAVKRVEACGDREVLALQADEWRDLPDSPEKDALMAAYRKRDADLAEQA